MSSFSRRGYQQEFWINDRNVRGFAEHAGMGVSLVLERDNGLQWGRSSRAFTLVNYQRLDTLETRLAIAREAYRLIRDLGGLDDLGPDAMPDMAVSAWVNRVCDELCR